MAATGWIESRAASVSEIALRFAPVSVEVARAELFAALERLRTTLDRAEPAEADLSSERLLSMNLISGVCAPLDRSA